MPRLQAAAGNRLRGQSLWRVLLLACCCFGLTSCGAPHAKQARTVTASTYPKLTLPEIAVSIEIIKKDATGLPEVIRVTYTNRTVRAGALELPGPVVGEVNAVYNTPAIAIFTAAGRALETDASSFGSDEWIDRHVGDDDYKGLLFLRSPPKSEWPKNASIVILSPNESFSVDYPMAEFCMTGHGIEPNAVANFRTCYKSGEEKTGIQVWLLGNDIEKFERTVSNVMPVYLTAPDTSIYPTEETSDPLPDD